MQRWTADSIPNQAGRTFLVTGANSGLGYVTTRELARHGAHVIMAFRNQAKGSQAVSKLRAEVPDASIEPHQVDISDLDAVAAFADQLNAGGTRINVLVNNAGIMMPPRSLSKQGFESQFATNHLGHFALTGLLLSGLRQAADARVVTVTSSLHRSGFIHFEDLNGETKYSPSGYYAQSKFANVLFALELDRRLRAAGIPVRSLLAHPGYSATNLQSTGPRGLLNFALKFGNLVLAQKVDMGALNQLYAATSPDVQSGQFFGPGGPGESRGYPTLVQPVASALDEQTAARLWDLSEELTGVHFGLPAGV